MTDEQKHDILSAWNSAQSRNREAQRKLHILEKDGYTGEAERIQTNAVLCAGSEILGMQAVLSALGIEVKTDTLGYAISVKEETENDPD